MFFVGKDSCMTPEKKHSTFPRVGSVCTFTMSPGLTPTAWIKSAGIITPKLLLPIFITFCFILTFVIPGLTGYRLVPVLTRNLYVWILNQIQDDSNYHRSHLISSCSSPITITRALFNIFITNGSLRFLRNSNSSSLMTV